MDTTAEDPINAKSIRPESLLIVALRCINSGDMYAEAVSPLDYSTTGYISVDVVGGRGNRRIKESVCEAGSLDGAVYGLEEV